jgi:hypothetical protein
MSQCWAVGISGGGVERSNLMPDRGFGAARSSLRHLRVAARPVMLSSSKDDLMQMVSSRRWGEAMLLDLRPITVSHNPSEFTCCCYDPTALIITLEDAQAAAETLLSMSSVGFGGILARPAPTRRVGHPGVRTLTCPLYAASPAATGLGWNGCWRPPKMSRCRFAGHMVSTEAWRVVAAL